MDRNIPDVRNIFGRGTTTDCSPKPKQELRSYEYSPRSRKRFEDFESYESQNSNSHNINAFDNKPSATNVNKRNSRHRSAISDDLIEPVRQGKKADDNKKSSKGKDASHYSNRTLTERDIRHLERTLSMKKTIRKQISRNLAQAFVDDPDLVLKDDSTPVAKATSNKKALDSTFTLTRAKVSKSEQNVLDLLKDNEPDSGHCSADNPNSSDDDTQEQIKQRHIANSIEKSNHDTRAYSDNTLKQDSSMKDDGKFSFWRMFSSKNRGRR